MPSFEEIQKARILNSFNTDEGLSELTKAEILDIEKGGKRAMIGEKRTFAGREYIKTANGWKFHGKGTGSAAQAHVAGALEHHVGEKKESDSYHSKDVPSKYTADDSWKDEESKKAASKPTHKNATDHFVEEDGKHYIDILDPDSGEKKFKPGDKVKYKDDSGKQHKGTISRNEHPDGDMYEVDVEQGEVGDTVRLRPEIKNASLSKLQDKPLKIKKIEEVPFASGVQRYFTVEVDGEDHEVAERFVEASSEIDPKTITDKQFASKEEKATGSKVEEAKGSQLYEHMSDHQKSIVDILVKKGNNVSDSIKRVATNYTYAMRTYPSATKSKIAEICNSHGLDKK